MLREETTDPVVGEMVKEPSELETEVTPPETQDPRISLKHPPESWMPLAKVEVAPDEKTSSEESLKPALIEEVAVFKMFKCVPCRPPENVEVPATAEATVKGPEKVEVAPLPKIVVVEVKPPTKIVEVAVKEVEEAKLKVCNANHLFALAMLREETTAPVVGEMVKEPSLFETEVTPPETQLPKISLKHPPDNWMPFANVEVAPEEKTSSEESLKPALIEEVAVFKMFRCPACSPLVKVEVPTVFASLTVIGPEKVEVAPLPRIVVVEVKPPTKIVEVAVKEVEEAKLKVCNASHLFALAMLREETTAPVVGEMVKEPSLFETEVTPPLTQIPSIAKHPSARLIPFEKVDEAEEEIIFKAEA